MLGLPRSTTQGIRSMNIAPQHLTAIVLAGGKSSRMGQEKGLVLHQGIPFVQHICNALVQITDHIIINTANPAYTTLGYPCIPDIIPDCGPVGGMYTSLYHTNTTYNIIVSCDVPLITPLVIRRLLTHHQADYNGTCYQHMPLIGVYNQNIVTTLYNHIQAKQLKLQKVLETLCIQSLPITEDIMHYTTNINTPKEHTTAIQHNGTIR